MLRVGINERVLLTGASINDKGSLEISFKQVGQEIVQVNADDFLNQAAGIKPSTGESKQIVWPVQIEQRGTVREAKDVAADLASVRDQLQHILQVYTTSDRAALNPYDGVEATSSALQNQSTVDRIYKNLTTQFVAKVKELKDKIAVTEIRVLLIRRSAASHYGTFRKRFITDNPFVESMEIPAANTRLKFTKYEIEKGLNNGDPVAKAEVADATETPAEGTDAASLILGSR